MRQTEMMPTELKVLSNHIYELQKGVRQMVLFTCPKQYEACATKRLYSQNMDFVLQPAGKNNLNFYIGRKECLNAIRLIVTRPLQVATRLIISHGIAWCFCTSTQIYFFFTEDFGPPFSMKL